MGKTKEQIKLKIWQILERFLLRKNLVLSKITPYCQDKRLDISRQAWNYVRIYSLELVAHEINSKHIAGQVAELGVYQGDFAQQINQAFPDRKLYLFDTFKGFDQRDLKVEEEKGLKVRGELFDDTAISRVLAKMAYRQNVIVKKGFFPESAAGLTEEFVFVSIDVDLYQPTYRGLDYFFPRLVQGGYIFVHDYNTDKFKGVKEAVRQYCQGKRLNYFPLCDLCGSAVILK